MEDDHSLTSYQSVKEGEMEDYETDGELAIADEVDVENQGNHLTTRMATVTIVTVTISTTGMATATMLPKIPIMRNQLELQEWLPRKGLVDQLDPDDSRNRTFFCILAGQSCFLPSSKPIPKYRSHHVNQAIRHESRAQGVRRCRVSNSGQ